MLDTTIQVKTDHFDGPLALLLLLIEKEEMNIRELDLTKITKQYLDYLSQMRDLNFDVAGDYLFLAATLLLLKYEKRTLSIFYLLPFSDLYLCSENNSRGYKYCKMGTGRCKSDAGRNHSKPYSYTLR